MQGRMGAMFCTMDFLFEWRTPPRLRLLLQHAVKSLVGNCWSELRTTFPMKVSWRFAIWFWMVGMLNNLSLTKLLTAWFNHKQRRGGVLHSNKKSIVQNIALILPCIGKTGTMNEWVHYALDNGYWKYLIANLGNSPKPQPTQEPSTSSSQNKNGRYSPPNSPSENETPPPSPPSLAPWPRYQARTPPETPQSPRTQNAQSTPPRSRFNFDPESVGKTKRDSLRILLMTDFATEREVKTQYRQLARIYHPDKYDQTSTQMTPRQSKEHFKLINNAYEFLQNILWYFCMILFLWWLTI